MRATRYLAIAAVILLLCSLLNNIPVSYSSNENERDGWLTFNTGVITIAIPRNGSIPLYFWWYNYDNKTIYVAHYFGLAEVWLHPAIRFRHKYMFKDELNISKQIIERLEETGFIKPEILDRISGIETEALGVLAEVMMKPSMAHIGRLNETLDKLEELNVSDVKDIVNQIKLRIIEIIDLIKQFNEASSFQEKKDIVDQIMDKAKEVKELFKQLRESIKEKLLIVKETMKRLRNAVKEMHPFFLPFAACKWELIPPKNITNEEGSVIGVEFGFILREAPKPFEFAENNTIIRNRMYYVTVEETVDDINYTLTKAELKSDLIIKRWVWNLDILKLYLGDYQRYMPLLKPNLILMAMFKVDHNVTNSTVKYMNRVHANIVRGKRLVLTPGTIVKYKGTSYKHSTEVEMELSIKLPKIIITSNETTVAGFFRFVPYAIVTYENETRVKVEVYGVFLLTTRHLFVSLIYPYFNGGELHHDPIFGIEGVTMKEEETPSYTVSVGDEGVESVSGGAEELTQVAKPLIDYTTLAALVIVITLAVVIAVAYRKGAK